MPTNEETTLNEPSFETLVQRSKTDIDGLRVAARVLTPVWQEWIGEVLDEIVSLRAQVDASHRALPIDGSVIDLNDSQLLDVLDREITARNLRWIAKADGSPAISTVPGAERHGLRDAIRAMLVLLRGSRSDGRCVSIDMQRVVMDKDDYAVMAEKARRYDSLRAEPLAWSAEWIRDQIADQIDLWPHAEMWTPQIAEQVRKIKIIATLAESASAGVDIKAAAARLMGWRLPDDFYPDCFVTFDRERAAKNGSWPTGTNLLTYAQAEEMLKYAFAEQLSRTHAADGTVGEKLDAPAQVGNTVFNKGVQTRLVIEAAQRNHQRLHNPTEEDKRIAAGTESMRALMRRIEIEHDAKSPFQREVEKLGIKPQRLGAVFDKVLHDNLSSLYIEEDKQQAEGAPMEDGWQLVPKVPTQAMRDAGFEAIPGILCCLATNVWDAMIAAAPTRQEGCK